MGRASAAVAHPAGSAAAAPRAVDGTAIVSGGTKGLGLQYARDAAAAGQRCLVLSSRKPALAKADLAAVAACGAAVFVVRCSTTDAPRCVEVAAWARERLPRVATYAHAAGAPGHDLLADVTPDMWHRVIRPKVMTSQIVIRVNCVAPGCSGACCADTPGQMLTKSGFEAIWRL